MTHRTQCNGLCLALAGMTFTGCALGLDLSGDPGEFYELDAGSGGAGTQTDAGVGADSGGEALIPQDAVLESVAPNDCISLDSVSMVNCEQTHDIVVVPGAFEAVEGVEFCILIGTFASIGDVERPPEPCFSPIERVVVSDGIAFTATRQSDGLSYVIYIDTTGVLAGFDIPGLSLIDIQLAPAEPQ